MDISFIPGEWSTENDLPYVLELVVSMDLTPEQRAEVLRAWGEAHNVAIEVGPIGGEE